MGVVNLPQQLGGPIEIDTRGVTLVVRHVVSNLHDPNGIDLANELRSLASVVLNVANRHVDAQHKTPKTLAGRVVETDNGAIVGVWHGPQRQVKDGRAVTVAADEHGVAAVHGTRWTRVVSRSLQPNDSVSTTVDSLTSRGAAAPASDV